VPPWPPAPPVNPALAVHIIRARAGVSGGRRVCRRRAASVGGGARRVSDDGVRRPAGEEVVRPAAAMVGVSGAEAVSVAVLFSFAFICARFLLDRLVYKVQ